MGMTKEEKTELRILTDIRQSFQKIRVGMNGRVSAASRGVDVVDKEQYQRLRNWEGRLVEVEDRLDKDIREMAKDLEIVQSMCKVKGVGLILAAKVVALVDIERADTVSALWRYAGYSVVDGKRERNKKGEKSHYNSRLKTACWLVAGSFLKSSSPYRRIYDSAREYYSANRPEWTDGHRHNAAMGRMIKVWLQHLWLKWRQMEGLPTNNPYAIDKLAHTHVITPQEFGWVDAAIKE